MMQQGAGLIRHRFVRLPILMVASLWLVLSPLATLGQPEDYYGAGGGGGEDYQDYTDPYGQQDNLYADYAAHQQDKLSSGGGG